jgi:signal transduction histidine kinase
LKLATRLWLYGALVPSLLLVAAFGLVGALLDGELQASVDRALLAQAAVESVSLFDRMDHAPHLHLDRSPLPASVRLTSATGAIYDPQGLLVAHEPAEARVPQNLHWKSLDPQPHIRTTLFNGEALRELLVAVRAPDGRPHVLRLAASLEHNQQTLIAYIKAATLTAFLVAIGLFALQLHHARALHGRVMRLHLHMQRLRAGDLASAPLPDDQHDVLTELRDAIAEATERLRVARDEKERLFADAAHELRTPLAAMRTDIDVTLRRDRTPMELRDTLERTRGEVDRLADLASRLLDLAATRQARWLVATQNVVAIVRDAKDAMTAAAGEKGVTIYVDAPMVLQARVDGAALRQVLDNLLANAVRFAQERVDVKVLRHGHRWQLLVADDGPGVALEEQTAIFLPFHRPDKRGVGSGLGLAIVRDVVQRHGGDVRVESTPGRGACFLVDLPLE